MEVDQVIAGNLKRLREQKGLSIAELSERTGLSKVTLSNLEKGGANPTINNIWKITRALDVPYTALLGEADSSAHVVHGADLSVQSSEDGHYRLVCYYPSSSERNFELFRVELDAGSSYTSSGHRNHAFEYVVALEGEVGIETAGESFALAQGDSLSFKASAQHTYINDGEQTAVMFIINYYPY